MSTVSHHVSLHMYLLEENQQRELLGPVVHSLIYIAALTILIIAYSL